MNIDFHYYGTYSAARIAGFNHEDAACIAWAAETVDEMSVSTVKETESFKEEADKKCVDRTNKPIATFQTLKEMGVDDVKYMDEDSEILQKVRAIWMAFHFLPGNFSNARPDGIITFDGVKESSNSKYESGDNLYVQLMCRNCTQTVRIMLAGAKTQYNSYIGSERKAALFAVGIAMHVLADTWSHELFVGSPSYWVNDVEDVRFSSVAMKRINAKPENLREYLSTLNKINGGNLPSDASIVYLGHGQIGYCPDLDFLEYYYVPRWHKDSKEFGYARRINNPERFQNAFAQLIDAMKYIKENEDYFNFRVYNQEDNKKSFENFRYIDDVREQIFCIPTSEYDSDLIAAERCRLWRRFILNNWNIEIGEYNFKNVDGRETEIKQFWRMARLHRNNVLSYVSDNTDYEYDFRVEKMVDSLMFD